MPDSLRQRAHGGLPEAPPQGGAALRLVGLVIGGLLCLGGVIGLIGSLPPTGDKAAGFIGSFVFLAVGAAVFALCVRPGHGRTNVALLAGAGTALFLVVIGGSMVWHGVVGLPRTYRRLLTAGVAAGATLYKCAPGLGGGNGVGCALVLDFRGFHRMWDYPENAAQFAGLPPGSRVQMLVDPADPTVAYTVTDVRDGTNAGWGPLAVFGAILGAAGIATEVLLVRLVLRLRSSA